jgi:hypothetical protein
MAPEVKAQSYWLHNIIMNVNKVLKQPELYLNKLVDFFYK